jgi:hypothetical protein
VPSGARAKILDDRVRAFIHKHRDAVVVDLGAGLQALTLAIGFFGDVHYDACAADLQYGINTVGLP